MKFLKFLSLAVVLFSGSTAWAQQGAEVVTDEELMKYAVAMDSVESMKKDLVESISELVKNHDQISAARYNELSKIITDETKLAEAKATPEEIAAIKEVLQKKDEGTAKIQETFQTLAKDYVGAAVYNKVRKALASDQELKSKYEAILAELKDDTD